MTAAARVSVRPQKPRRSAVVPLGIVAAVALTGISLSKELGIGLDLGELIEDIGRGGDIIRTSGAQVSPREVEAAISDITGGRMSFVIGVPDPERGQVVTAVLVGDAAFEEEDLKARLRQRLSAYKVPRRFVALADRELPTLSSGKVDLRQLVERVRER